LIAAEPSEGTKPISTSRLGSVLVSTMTSPDGTNPHLPALGIRLRDEEVGSRSLSRTSSTPTGELSL
jgi:hypothetical protein